jgi:TonB-linked SusC/RagA family outer membrane protein
MNFFTKKMRRMHGLLFAMLSLLFFQQAIAQSQIVTGKVTDANTGEPVIGATVMVVGTTTGVAADVNGDFKISAPANSTLQFKSVGYTPFTIKADPAKPMQIKLTGIHQDLNEVVVIGYGTAQKKDLTGSVSTLKTDRLEKESPVSVQDLLRSGIPGLVVGQSNGAKGGGDIQLRGQRSLKADNSPLLVVDDVIYFGEMSEINPLDIEQITVLKDASAAAIYGAKASNGVIIITTKKGKNAKPTIRLSANNGLVTLANQRPVYDGPGYIQYRQDLANSTANFATPGKYINPTPENLAAAGETLAQWRAFDAINGPSNEDIYLQRLGLFDNERNNYFAGKTYDWFKNSFQRGYNQDYNLSASGKTVDGNTNYYMSLGKLKTEGVVNGAVYGAYRASAKLDQKINNWLTTGFNVNFQDRSDGNFAVDWKGQIINNSPYAVAMDDARNLIGQPMGNGSNQGVNSFYSNQYKQLESGYDVLNTTLYAKVKLPFNITLNTNYAPRFQWFYKRYHESALNPLWTDNGKVEREQKKNFDWLLDNTLNWDATFGQKHRVKVTLLQNAEEHRSWDDDMIGKNFTPTDALGFHNIGAANLPDSQLSTNDIHSTGSALMARLFYSYEDRYMLTATLRRDGYSAFGENHPWATFPSLGFAWNFGDEKFLKWPPLSTGKLRLSWGRAGNRGLSDPYQALANLTTGTGKFGYITQAGVLYNLGQLYQSRLANHDLKWETTTSWNAGIDFGFFNNRINGSIDVYHAPTTDLLVDRALPGFTAFSSITSNLGQVDNDGLELSLNGAIMKKTNFQWNASVSLFLNRNTVKHLYYTYHNQVNADGSVSSVENDDITNSYFIGHDINAIWTYKVIGIWQKGEETDAKKYNEVPGDPKVLDVNNDGKLDNNDKLFLGSGKPRFRWTMRHDFTLFHNLDISMNFYSYIGQSATSDDYRNNTGALETRSSSYIRNYWTPTNPTNDYARLNSGNPSSIGPVQVLDRSFVRFDNLAFSYLIPTKITKKLNINQVRFTAGVRNVAVWSPKYKLGWDPEEPINDGDTPPFLPRIYNLGVNVTF